MAPFYFVQPVLSARPILTDFARTGLADKPYWLSRMDLLITTPLGMGEG
jgi:hypothetical protein